MKTTRFLLIVCTSLGVLLLSLLAIPGPAYAGQAPSTTTSLTGTPPAPGNQCLSCHSSGDTRLAGATAWQGNIQRQTNSPCPAQAKLQEELYLSERLLLSIDNARSQLPGSADLVKTDAKLTGLTQSYERLLDTPVDSLGAFTSEAQVLRFKLGKVYTQLAQQIDQGRLNRVLIFAGLVTLLVLVAFGWGLYNTRRVRATGGLKNPFKFYTIRLVFILLVFGFFALPIFSVPATVTTTSAEDAARQVVLDSAQRAADMADQAQGRAWMLGRVASAWDQPEKAQAGLQAALQAFDEAEMNTAALWGHSQAIQEASANSSVALGKASLVAGDLGAAQAQRWSLARIAEDWLAADVDHANAVLQIGVQMAISAGTGIYRDLDLRSLAIVFNKLDPANALAVANQIDDPAIRSWGLREIAAVNGDPAVFAQAIQAAEQVQDPIQRARALGELATCLSKPRQCSLASNLPASDTSGLVAAARQGLASVQGASLAYALSDLAAASGEVELVAVIDPAYPDAQAWAYLRLGQYDLAWQAAGFIQDPYERARAQAEIAAANQDASLAGQIAIPVLRERAMRDIAIQTGDVSLAASLTSVYDRITALTALGQYSAAWQAASTQDSGLVDTYPLKDLAVAWATGDPQAALAVVDKMDREADKAVALRAAAAASLDQTVFERALGMALAARVRGNALAPVEASLQLGLAFPQDPAKMRAAFTQAEEAAQRIAIK